MSAQEKDKDFKDLEIMESRKKIELMEKAVLHEKDKIIRQKHMMQRKIDRKFLNKYLYDKGEEILNMAEAQFPIQTSQIIHKIVELIRTGDIKGRISGRELLTLFRSVGIHIRINTTIQIEDHGKLIPLSDKLRQKYGVKGDL